MGDAIEPHDVVANAGCAPMTCRECHQDVFNHSSGICYRCTLDNHSHPYSDYERNCAWHDARNAREKKEAARCESLLIQNQG